MTEDYNLKERIQRYLSKGLSVGFVDEVGCGSLVGDVYTCCLVAFKKIPRNKQVNDSKLLTPKQRETVCSWLMSNFRYGIGTADISEIDRLNVHQAKLLAMKRSVLDCGVLPDILFVDGPAIIQGLPECEQIPVVRGDSKIFGIAGASIVAKVTRDLYMKELAVKFPQYGWDKNAGYAVDQHKKAMKEFGVTPYHRATFKPVREVLPV